LGRKNWRHRAKAELDGVVPIAVDVAKCDFLDLLLDPCVFEKTFDECDLVTINLQPIANERTYDVAKKILSIAVVCFAPDPRRRSGGNLLKSTSGHFVVLVRRRFRYEAKHIKAQEPGFVLRRHRDQNCGAAQCYAEFDEVAVCSRGFDRFKGSLQTQQLFI